MTDKFKLNSQTGASFPYRTCHQSAGHPTHDNAASMIFLIAISSAVAKDLDLQNIQEAHQEAQEKVGSI